VLPKGVAVTRDASGDAYLCAGDQQFLLLPGNAWHYKMMRQQLSTYLHSQRKPARCESSPKQGKTDNNDKSKS
jgi:hypothetical protein